MLFSRDRSNKKFKLAFKFTDTTGMSAPTIASDNRGPRAHRTLLYKLVNNK